MDMKLLAGLKMAGETEAIGHSQSHHKPAMT
jgi:hypothetical protein